MHVFDSYASPSAAAEVDLVRRNPFALVVSAGPTDAPVATHVPVVFPQDRPLPDALDGATLLGHMARVNPQWRSLAADRAILLVFASGHGYVSPSTYGREPAVPTLNYAAVHITGTVELVDDGLHVVEETVRALEGLRSPAWDMTASRERFVELAPRVVAFRVLVTSVRSMFKLSQDMPADIRDRVRADVRCACPNVADLMAEVDPRHSA